VRQNYEEARRYREDRKEFYGYMLKSIASLVGLIFPLILSVSAFLYAVTLDAKHASETNQIIGEGISVVMITIAAVLGYRKLDRMLSVAYRVSHFLEYESRIKPDLESKELRENAAGGL
jgi:hypothetical protein